MINYYKEVIAAEFGFGDIIVSASTDADSLGFVLLTNANDYYPIGYKGVTELDKLTFDELLERSDIMLKFNNTESLSAVISHLEDLKNLMLANKKESEAKDEIFD